MTLYDLLRDCDIEHHLANNVKNAHLLVVVKRKNQHPNDPPLGMVIDYHYNDLDSRHEILIS